ncbi:hypothetical protein [Filobacillus milosensis]|nr:hypothetical protein [Filobacillus milosensis]
MEEKNNQMNEEEMMTESHEEKRDPWSDLLFGRRPVQDMAEENDDE